jgi:hypothetical protein
MSFPENLEQNPASQVQSCCGGGSTREATGVSDGVALQAALSHLACHSNEVSNLYGRHRFHGE